MSRRFKSKNPSIEAMVHVPLPDIKILLIPERVLLASCMGGGIHPNKGCTGQAAAYYAILLQAKDVSKAR